MRTPLNGSTCHFGHKSNQIWAGRSALSFMGAHWCNARRFGTTRSPQHLALQSKSPTVVISSSIDELGGDSPPEACPIAKSKSSPCRLSFSSSLSCRSAIGKSPRRFQWQVTRTDSKVIALLDFCVLAAAHSALDVTLASPRALPTAPILQGDLETVQLGPLHDSGMSVCTLSSHFP